jgi:hypothetical protein
VPLPSPAATVAPSVLAACGRLVAALPDEIDPGVTRRPVDGPARFAAWGEPPVLLECGVPVPDRLDEPAQVNGVLWSVRDVGDGFRWTTTELGINVAVDIPGAYANGAELVNPLAEPLRSTLPAAPSPAPGG